jgi:hypothetical protein
MPRPAIFFGLHGGRKAFLRNKVFAPIIKIIGAKSGLKIHWREFFATAGWNPAEIPIKTEGYGQQYWLAYWRTIGAGLAQIQLCANEKFAYRPWRNSPKGCAKAKQ